ncbi:MAG TPA: hypothetical protein VET82_12335 [Candidatus Eisenbacteria bacterium]|nr:hypothetical protein [Candidatus Eisenbacteria bacterium]
MLTLAGSALTGAAQTEAGYSCGWRWITRPQIRHLITVSLSSD